MRSYEILEICGTVCILRQMFATFGLWIPYTFVYSNSSNSDIQVISIWESKDGQNQTLTSFWMSSNRKWPLFKSTNGNAETSSLKNTAANQEQLIVPKVMFFPLWNHIAAAMCRNLTNVIYIINNVSVKTCQCTWHNPELQHSFDFTKGWLVPGGIEIHGQTFHRGANAALHG